MSVSFHVAICDGDLKGFEVYDHENEQGHMFPDYKEAVKGWHALGADSMSWSISARYDIPDDYSVSMCNGNAADVVEALGYPREDYCDGEAEPDDLIGRCLIAVALAPDPSLPAYEQVGQRGARLIDVGRDAGYIREKCSQIRALAEQAKLMGRTVVWN